MLTTKGSFCNIFQALEDCPAFLPPRAQNFQVFGSFRTLSVKFQISDLLHNFSGISASSMIFVENFTHQIFFWNCGKAQIIAESQCIFQKISRNLAKSDGWKCGKNGGTGKLRTGIPVFEIPLEPSWGWALLRRINAPSRAWSKWHAFAWAGHWSHEECWPRERPGDSWLSSSLTQVSFQNESLSSPRSFSTSISSEVSQLHFHFYGTKYMLHCSVVKESLSKWLPLLGNSGPDFRARSQSDRCCSYWIFALLNLSAVQALSSSLVFIGER